MKKETIQLAIKALKRDRIDSDDNLRRATRQAERSGADAKWCATTGKTVGQLRDEYQAAVNEYDAAIAELEAL